MQGCLLRRLDLVSRFGSRWGKYSSIIRAATQVALVLAVISQASHDAWAKKSQSSRQRASTSNKSRLEAIRAIPLEKVSPQHRDRVRQVLSDCSLYRRLPTQMVDCDPKMFTFLAQNPEMLVEIWRLMGISQVDLVRTGPDSFRLSDNAGTTGKLHIVEQQCNSQAQNRIVMYAHGGYESSTFKQPIRAQCVLLLRTGSTKETNGRDYVAARLDSFIRINRTSIKLFAKAIHPLVGKTADTNFKDTMTFVSNFSRASEEQPEKVEQLVGRLPRVSRERQTKLISIAYESRREAQTEIAVVGATADRR